MNADRDVTPIVRSWLQQRGRGLADPYQGFDRFLGLVDATPQARRRWWVPGRPRPAPTRSRPTSRRFQVMSSMLKLTAVAVVVLTIGVGFGQFLPSSNNIGSGPSQSPTPSASPVVLGHGPVPAGTYTETPWADPAGGHGGPYCEPPAVECSEMAVDDGISFTFTVPDGWAGGEGWALLRSNNTPPGGANMLFLRGGWLLSDPCADPDAPDIPVGPAVDDFISALVDHPLLDVTTPVDVTLGGYSGKYLELQGPADLSACPYFWVWAPNIYAQGPDQRWHLWVLDVDGVRVVVRTDTYPGTSPEVQAELQGIVDSLRIGIDPRALPSPTLSTSSRAVCPSDGRSSGTRLAPARYIMVPNWGCPTTPPGWPDRTVSVFVPEGWITSKPGMSGGIYHSDGTHDGRSAEIFFHGLVASVPADLCDAESAMPLGPTVDDLAVALAALDVPGLETTVAEATVLDGFVGKRIDVTMPADPSDCEFSYSLMGTPDIFGEHWGFRSPPSWTHRVWILDIDGVRFVMDGSSAPDASPEVLAELDQLVQSTEFAPLAEGR